MSGAGRIVRIDPRAGIPGGEIVIDCADYDTSNPRSCHAVFETVVSRPVGVSPRRVLTLIPDTNLSGETKVLLSSNGSLGESANFSIGRKLADDLHLVANPAFDPDDGSLYVTRSGSRGQQFPVTIFRIDAAGVVSDFTGDVANPTGLAFDKSGQMFVTSRLDGNVYRMTPFKEPVAFARNLGVATGLAFDREGRMYVGDRTGTIYRVNGIGEEKVWAQLEPSVSAYHLAFGPDNALYVTGPTVSSFEVMTRIDESGAQSVFYRGLGRPHGLAFDSEGYLYVAASLRGRRGIVRIAPDGGEAEMFVAGMNVVGLAFSAAGDMVVATGEAVYSLPLGIRGALL